MKNHAIKCDISFILKTLDLIGDQIAVLYLSVNIFFMFHLILLLMNYQFHINLFVNTEYFCNYTIYDIYITHYTGINIEYNEYLLTTELFYIEKKCG